jgi:alanine dehydrogenase
MTGVLGRTATHTMSNATWPFIDQIAEIGVAKALKQIPALNNGVYTTGGKVVHQAYKHVLEGRNKL